MERKELRLGDVCTKITDGSHFSPKAQTEGYPMLSVKDMREYDFDFSNCKKISYEDYLKMERDGCVPQIGDVLVAKDGSYLKEIFICKEQREIALLSSIAIFRPNSQLIDSRFLCYCLKSPRVYNYISLNCVSGSALPRIILKDFKGVNIRVPSLDDQRRIANILSSLDQKIELNNKINADLEEMAQAIFKNWFVDFEPFKAGKFVDSELGMIPEGWKVVKLGDFFPVKTGKKDANTASVNGKYPFFSCSQNALCTDSYSFDCDAILVAGNGDFNVKWYSGKFDAYQRTYVLIPYNKKLLALLYYVVKRNLLTITSKARGSVIRFITKGNLTDFEFAIPRDLENNEIVDVFKSINEKIFANIKENSRLSLLRDTLLPRLMSGELEVPE